MLLFFRACKHAAIAEKCGINLCYHPARPKKRCTSLSVIGTRNVWTVSTLAVSLQTPSADTTCPKKVIDHWNRLHFDRFRVNPAASNMSELFNVLKMILDVLGINLNYNIIERDKTELSKTVSTYGIHQALNRHKFIMCIFGYKSSFWNAILIHKHLPIATFEVQCTEN